MANQGKQGVSKYFYDIAEEVPADKWKDFARKLQIKEVQIGRIEAEEKGIVKECCMKVLNQWRMKNGRKATLEVLRKALEDAELGDIAENIKDEELHLRIPVQETAGNGSGAHQPSTQYVYSQVSQPSSDDIKRSGTGLQPEDMDCEDYDDSLLLG
ncbi:tumor necrosis factor receptor superfamily member 1A-like [Branchiostoma lanceolatum]|uniref:tumor necrosis factor receptor superfamily member 1A-like n=1 Tax=Branchiostoma lanceolatum TaxID=7740 RepID=UPI003456EDD0